LKKVRFCALFNPQFAIEMLGYLFRIFKRLLLWGYARNTWQYDVLCACILAFIFLTPQHWFDSGKAMKNGLNSEPTSNQLHQNSVASKVVFVSADDFPAQMTESEIANRVRNITGRTDVEILGFRPKLDASGKTVAYEVDIK
jgi:hypothetical protein